MVCKIKKKIHKYQVLKKEKELEKLNVLQITFTVPINEVYKKLYKHTQVVNQKCWEIKIIISISEIYLYLRNLIPYNVFKI